MENQAKTGSTPCWISTELYMALNIRINQSKAHWSFTNYKTRGNETPEVFCLILGNSSPNYTTFYISIFTKRVSIPLNFLISTDYGGVQHITPTSTISPETCYPPTTHISGNYVHQKLGWNLLISFYRILEEPTNLISNILFLTSKHFKIFLA